MIDTDPGIDDALAILLALASPEVDLRLVTTVHGNVELAQTTENALRVLQLAGRSDVPVAAGARARWCTRSRSGPGTCTATRAWAGWSCRRPRLRSTRGRPSWPSPTC